MHHCTQCTQPCNRPPPNHTSATNSWTAPFSWVLVCKRFVCSLQESVSQSCVSSGVSMMGLMATSSKRAYAIPRSAAPRAPAPAVGSADPYLHRRHSSTVLRRVPSKRVGATVVTVGCWKDFEDIPHVQGQRRSPSKMVGMVKLCLESNPITSRDTQRTQTNLVRTRSQRPHRDWDVIIHTIFFFNTYMVKSTNRIMPLFCDQAFSELSPNMMRALDKCVLLVSRGRMHEKQTV